MMTTVSVNEWSMICTQSMRGVGECDDGFSAMLLRLFLCPSAVSSYQEVNVTVNHHHSLPMYPWEGTVCLLIAFTARLARGTVPHIIGVQNNTPFF